MNLVLRKLVRWGYRDLASAEENVKMLRGWAARAPGGTASLAQALLYRAGLQIGDGLHDEALDSIDEVVALHGRADRTSRTRRLRWGWLHARAGWLRAVVAFQREEFDAAVRTAEEATDEFRALVAADAKRFEPSYALVLTHLANCYYAADRLDDAVRAGERAAEVARRVHARGDECDIAGTLADLCGRLHIQDRDEEAVRYGRVAVNILRRHPNPPVLAAALVNLGVSLARTRPREALAATDEALVILDELMVDDPATYEPRLTHARNNRAITLDRLRESRQ